MESRLYNYECPLFSVRRSSTTGEGHNVSFVLHSHDFFEIFVLKSEKATFFVEGNIYALSEGDMMIFNSTELHNVSFDNSTVYERFVIHFMPEMVFPFESGKYNLLNAFTSRKPGKRNLIPAKAVAESGAEECLKKINSVLTSPAAEYTSVLIQALLVQLLIHINNAVKTVFEQVTAPTYSERIGAIISYINNNLSEDLSLNKLSANFYISKYNLCHIFKQATGFSVKQYITYKRVIYAQKLLSEGKSTLDACVGAGFNDYSNFYKTFKKTLGKPPKRYKHSVSK